MELEYSPLARELLRDAAGCYLFRPAAVYRNQSCLRPQLQAANQFQSLAMEQREYYTIGALLDEFVLHSQNIERCLLKNPSVRKCGP